MTLDADTARRTLRPGDVVVDVDEDVFRVVDLDPTAATFCGYGPMGTGEADLARVDFGELVEYIPRDDGDDTRTWTEELFHNGDPDDVEIDPEALARELQADAGGEQA